MDEQQYCNDNNVLTIQDLHRETDFNKRYVMQCGVCVCVCVCECVAIYKRFYSYKKIC